MKTKIFTRENTHSLYKNLIQGGSYLFAAVFVLFIILFFTGKSDTIELIAAIVSGVLFVALRAVLAAYYSKPKTQETSSYKFFFSGLKVIIVIVLLLGILGVYQIFTASDCGSCAVYQAIGLGIIVIWACVFLSYFVWAVYYYNINLGLPEEEWNKIFEAKQKKEKGEPYSKDDLDVEPKFNPYQADTFGLPGGTVRGMIAFTLLFGAISMLIVSIGMENQLDANAMFWDQYEFFKTAFLMMIAFYFGNSALKYLKDRNKPVFLGENNNQDDAGEILEATAMTSGAQDQELPVINPMDSQEADKPKSKKNEPKPGESTFDPMKPKA